MIRILTVLVLLFWNITGSFPAHAFDPATFADAQREDQIWADYETRVTDAQSAMMGSPNDALRLAAEAAALVAALPDTDERRTAQATATWLQSEALNRLNRSDEARQRVQDGLMLLGEDAPSSKLLGDIRLSGARIDHALGHLEEALAGYQAAHDIFVEVGVPRSQTIALLKVGDIYNEAEDFAKAIRYYQDAEQAFSEDPSLSMVTQNNLGNALRGKGDYAEGELRFRKALEIATGFESPMLNARILTNIASVQRLDGRLGEAEKTVDQGLAQQAGDQPSGWEPFLWGVKAQIAVARGEWFTARAHLEKTFLGQELKSTPMPFREFHETAHQVYAQLGDPVKSLAHHVAFKRLNDESLGVVASASAALMAAQFDFAHQDLKIEQLRTIQLEQDIALAKARERQRNLVFTGVLVIGGLLFGSMTIVALNLRRSKNRIQTIADELQITNVKLEKANNAKTEFLATTSHEIRTPLNGILGMTQVALQDPDASPKMLDRLKTVRSAGNAMKALVDDLLDVAKFETGEVRVEAGETELRSVLTDVCLLWKESAEGSGLLFTSDLEACPELAVTDGNRIRQIAYNLLSNATKFTEQGFVNVGTGTEISGDQTYFTLSVHDSGIGIASLEHEKIFESFYQVDGAKSRKFSGTGLGLATSRKFARALGGDITVESELDKGATFTLRIPLEIVVKATDQFEGDLPELDQVAHAHLLIFEPNMLNQMMLEHDLEADVARVEIVGSADEFESRLIDDKFHILVVTASDLEFASSLTGNLANPPKLICVSETMSDGISKNADRTIVGNMESEAILSAIGTLLSINVMVSESKAKVNGLSRAE